MRAITISILLFSAGCKAPAEAPQKFEELCVYLFAHMADEEPEALFDGLDNLGVWLEDHPEEPLDGYTVANLDQATIDTIPGEPDALDVKGAAVMTDSPYTAEQLAEALIIANQVDVFPDTFESFDRDFLSDEECFMDMECDTVSLFNGQMMTFPLGITMYTESESIFRWVDMEDSGHALMSRAWQLEPGEVSVSWLQIGEQFYFSAVVPKEGGAYRLQSVWVVAEIVGADLPEGTALKMTVNGLRERDETLYAWMEEEGY